MRASGLCVIPLQCKAAGISVDCVESYRSRGDKESGSGDGGVREWSFASIDKVTELRR